MLLRYSNVLTNGRLISENIIKTIYPSNDTSSSLVVGLVSTKEVRYLTIGLIKIKIGMFKAVQNKKT
jgi:hypothetical protein